MVALNDAEQYDGDWTWTPNSTWVNDFRLGYIYVIEQTLGADGNLLPSNPWPNGYGMNTGVTTPIAGGFPTISSAASAAPWGRRSDRPPRSPRGRRSRGQRFVFARQARLQVWL